jgi:Uncharacterized protein conserved in bacteria
MADIKTDFLIEQINRLKNKKYEIAILSPIILDKDLSVVEPYTQYPVQNYFIDLYYSTLKLAIEIDETHHEGLEENDNERQMIIEETLDCEFYRIKTDEINDVYETVNNLKGKILLKVSELQSRNEFSPWIPREFDMAQVQEDYPNAIFYKTNMAAIDKEHDPLRGPLKINQENRAAANLFVTLSGNTVISVYNIDATSWKEFPDNNRGFYQLGKELPNHPLISSGTTSWHSTTNKMYGKNILRNIQNRRR